eukprot:COSAG06_NODE_755_length_12532_cov_10.124990_12_plen_59_part_00
MGTVRSRCGLYAFFKTTPSVLRRSESPAIALRRGPADESAPSERHRTELLPSIRCRAT